MAYIAGMKWEYNTVRFGIRGSSFDWEKFEDVLFRRGEDGWELVSVESFTAHGSTNLMLLCFKRPGDPSARGGGHR